MSNKGSRGGEGASLGKEMIGNDLREGTWGVESYGMSEKIEEGK